MRVHGRDHEYGDELPVQMGSAGGRSHPFEMTDQEADELLAELRQIEARRRPCGFAPWPDDEQPQ